MRRALLIVPLALLALAAPAAAKTFDNPKGSLTVPEHSTFTIALDVRTGTGFTWKVTKKPAAEVVKYLNSRTGAPARPGGPSQQMLKFSALDAGSTSMTLSYVGPGKNARVAETLDLKVKVTKT